MTINHSATQILTEQLEAGTFEPKPNLTNDVVRLRTSISDGSRLISETSTRTYFTPTELLGLALTPKLIAQGLAAFGAIRFDRNPTHAAIKLGFTGMLLSQPHMNPQIFFNNVIPEGYTGRDFTYGDWFGPDGELKLKAVLIEFLGDMDDDPAVQASLILHGPSFTGRHARKIRYTQVAFMNNGFVDCTVWHAKINEAAYLDFLLGGVNFQQCVEWGSNPTPIATALGSDSLKLGRELCEKLPKLETYLQSLATAWSNSTKPINAPV